MRKIDNPRIDIGAKQQEEYWEHMRQKEEMERWNPNGVEPEPDFPLEVLEEQE